MTATLERSLVLRVLQHGLDCRRPEGGLLHHADRGSQYASSAQQALLAEAEITPRMRRTGNCWDTAVMERFFASLKAEIGVEVFDAHAHG